MALRMLACADSVAHQDEIETDILGSKKDASHDELAAISPEAGEQHRASGCCSVLWSLLQDRTVVLVTLIYAIFSFGVIGFDGACQACSLFDQQQCRDAPAVGVYRVRTWWSLVDTGTEYATDCSAHVSMLAVGIALTVSGVVLIVVQVSKAL
jgi:hypothetical protein